MASRLHPGRFLRDHPAWGAVIGFGASLTLAGSASGVSLHILSTLDSELNAATRVVEVVEVPMVNEILGAGEVLSATNVTLQPMGVEYVPDGVARTVDELVGRTVKERLLPGEVIALRRLTPPGTEPGLSALVGVGQRALALKLQDAGRVAGFVEPGDLVDIVVTFEDADDCPPKRPPCCSRSASWPSTRRCRRPPTGRRDGAAGHPRAGSFRRGARDTCGSPRTRTAHVARVGRLLDAAVGSPRTTARHHVAHGHRVARDREPRRARVDGGGPRALPSARARPGRSRLLRPVAQ